MKKPDSTPKSKSTGSKSSTAGTGRKRHAKESKKPVTIDVTAQTVSKPTTDQKTAEAPRTSVPKASSTTATFGRDAGKPIEAKAEAEKGVEAGSAKSEMQQQDETSVTASTDAPVDKKTGPSADTGKATPPKEAVNKISPAAQPQKSGTSGRIAAGIVGGLIALGGGFGLQSAGVLPAPTVTPVIDTAALDATRTDLTNRITELESKLTAAQNTSPALDPAAVKTAVAEELQNLQQQQTAAVSPDEISTIREQLSATGAAVEALKEQLAVSEKAVEDMMAAVSQGGSGSQAANEALTNQLESIRTSVAELQKGLSEVRDRASSAVGEELQGVVRGLQAQLPALKQELEGRLGKLQNSVSEMAGAAEQLPSLSEGLQAVRSTAEKLTGDLTSVRETLDEQTSAVGALQQAAETSRATGQSAARAIAAAALKSDIDRGVPFSESLATLRAVAPDNDALAALEPLAEKPIPTVDQLAEDFTHVGDAIVEALAPPSDGSFSDRLLKGAQSLIKVRPITPQAGDSPAAIVSRIAAALKSSDLAAAHAQWQELPEAGQTVSAQWHQNLQARMTANAVVADTIQSFLLSNAGQ